VVHCFRRYRLAGPFLPPGATCARTPLPPCYRLAGAATSPSAASET